MKERMDGILHEMMAHMLEVEAGAAKRNPKRDRCTRIFEKPMNYRYYTKKNNERVRFCYSVHRNVAGYFLIWRETITKKEARRDQWDATKDKRDAIATCRLRAGE